MTTEELASLPTPADLASEAFRFCLSKCAATPEFVAEFNRLTGRRLGQSQKRSPFDIAIDKACGFSGETDEDMAAFCAFVWETVYSRLPMEEAK